MNDRRPADVVQHLRRLVRPCQGAGLGDGELLRRWVVGRDEAAFEVLVWRHGPMVHGVCRRVLRDRHEAEDAFQAVFLALARKATSIGKREAIAGWLYRVAYRAALRAKLRASHRPQTDAATLDGLAARPTEDLIWRDLRTVLDEEVNRLSAKYREPFVLHYLQGYTNEEVARELGCPVGTVLSRLGRARERLRGRLTRRGLALSATTLGVGLSVDVLSAAVPPGIVGPLVKAATLLASGRVLATGLVSANAVTLMGEVLRGMTMTKLKLLGVAVMVLALIGTGTGVLLHEARGEQRAADQPRPPQPADPQPRVPSDDVRRAKERVDALEHAKKVLAEAEDVYRDAEAKHRQVFSRQDQVRLEETLRSLERQQATERDRELEQWKAIYAAVNKDGDEKRIAEFEKVTKRNEEQRTERLIETRLKLVRWEEESQQIEGDWAFRREMARTRLRDAAERVRRLEDDAPPAPPPAKSLGEVERKLRDLLRDVEELRRADGR